jgi:peptidoglycan/LPS O-acetylase OafA/YrhL
MTNFKIEKEIVTGILLIIISFLVFQFNIFNTAPSFQFKTYRDGSEALVLGKILADIKGIKIEKANLGFVFKGEAAPRSDVLSAYERVNHVGKVVPFDLSDTNWSHGFATFGPVLLFNKTAVAKLGYGENELLSGDHIEFSDQQIRTVTKTNVVGEYLHVTYSGNRIDQEKITNLKISILNEKLKFEAYSKQFGLQGLTFSYLYKIIPDAIKNVSGLQAISTLFFSIIVVLLARELSLLIDIKFGLIFYLCMIGSPWIVSIARNLYWVPVLWLLPVYLSFISFRRIKINRYSENSIFVYGLIFGLAIFIKSLCGYEYLPLIFIFSLLPFFMDVGKPINLQLFVKPWRSCLIIFMFGVIGFLFAFVFHASLRSDDIIDGLMQTIKLDVFKYNTIGQIIGAPSFGIKSSYLDLAVKYIFDWHGAVYFGIESRWAFPILLFGSGTIVVFDLIRKNPIGLSNLILWLTAFFSSISWSILMKDHSIIHTHLNFVLWYLFFIPAATYLILQFLISNINIVPKILKHIFFKDTMLEHEEKSKRNNFTLLRMILATSVLFGHSFPIVGKGSDPISVALLQPTEWIGSMAVNGFFFISGFLVVGSFVRRGAFNYILSRALRLYPAVLVYSVITILVIGPIFSSVSLNEYFLARPWFNFINAGLWQWSHNLPFVFQHNPIPGATNGSAWTLPAELRSYILICCIGFFGALDTKIRANFSLIGLLLVCRFFYSDLPLFGGYASFQTPLIYFLTGSIFLINRNIIPMNHYVNVFFCLLTVISIKFGFLYFMLPIFMGYILLNFVYRVPYINVDRVGDLSYGIYIYAWPVQQLIWYPGQGPYENFFISLFFVSFLAYLSWHFVEKPALDCRKNLVSTK